MKWLVHSVLLMHLVSYSPLSIQLFLPIIVNAIIKGNYQRTREIKYCRNIILRSRDF